MSEKWMVQQDVYQCKKYNVVRTNLWTRSKSKRTNGDNKKSIDPMDDGDEEEDSFHTKTEE